MAAPSVNTNLTIDMITRKALMINLGHPSR